MLIKKKRIYSITDITAGNIMNMEHFVQGAVYCWCKNRPDEWFSIRELFGGQNFDWNGTPLQHLYVKHILQGRTPPYALKKASIDAGRLLAGVLQKDVRIFDNRDRHVNEYLWIVPNSQPAKIVDR